MKSNVDPPVFNTFHIRLAGDEKKNNDLRDQLQSEYGDQGPVDSNPIYMKYKIQPGSLRAVGAYFVISRR